ncbi:kinase [Candidatus Clostridium radicumherbarum]|uniref:Kinase n=1 Tax=Candidatus Clostridium radicumherbarum TaxID=3381662 RepID=A0ABW8TTJ1_9CLOT
MEATACYPGSIGEIIQGSAQGQDILVSCPINLYTEVKVFESTKPNNKYKYEKSAVFLNNIITSWGYESYEKTLDFKICSEIPKGKGFASSTADLCALYYALLKLFNKQFNEVELIKECIKIEPTDSILFKEMTMFDYKAGSFYEVLGRYLKFSILVFEGSNIVNTIEFNKRAILPQKNIEDLIPALKKGLIEKDIRKIGTVSTESIIRNQHRLRYDFLEDIIEVSSNYGGLGVIGAHSGDCLGIIFEDEEKMNYVKRHNKYKDAYKIYTVNTVDIKS